MNEDSWREILDYLKKLIYLLFKSIKLNNILKTIVLCLSTLILLILPILVGVIIFFTLRNTIALIIFIILTIFTIIYWIPHFCETVDDDNLYK